MNAGKIAGRHVRTAQINGPFAFVASDRVVGCQVSKQQLQTNDAEVVEFIQKLLKLHRFCIAHLRSS